MKVYIVESDFGCYEDYTKVINGIYARPEIAEIEAQKIRDHYKEMRDRCTPAYELMDSDDITDEEYERLIEMLDDYNEAIEYNQTVVKEYDVID